MNRTISGTKAIHMTRGLLLLLLLLLVHIAAGQRAEKFTSQNPCVSKTTCSGCIQTKTCAWCLQPQAEYGDSPRCFQPSYDLAQPKCPEEYTYNPDSELKQIINKELTRRSYEGMSAAGAMQGGAGEYEYGSSYHSSSSGSASASQSSSSSFRGHSASSSSSGEIVQIKPQKVNLKLRISECCSD